MEHIVFGILAQVDAGKTTLSESLLFSAGALKKVGRVDKKDAFLDNYQSRQNSRLTAKVSRSWTLRGMWIFRWKWKGCCPCLMRLSWL